MAYKCHKCEATILVLRLGYCINCREPISEEILPESKKQALAAAEREYEEMRDRIRAQKDGNSKEGETLETPDLMKELRANGKIISDKR